MGAAAPGRGVNYGSAVYNGGAAGRRNIYSNLGAGGNYLFLGAPGSEDAAAEDNAPSPGPAPELGRRGRPKKGKKKDDELDESEDWQPGGHDFKNPSVRPMRTTRQKNRKSYAEPKDDDSDLGLTDSDEDKIEAPSAAAEVGAAGGTAHATERPFLLAPSVSLLHAFPRM